MLDTVCYKKGLCRVLVAEQSETSCISPAEPKPVTAQASCSAVQGLYYVARTVSEVAHFSCAILLSIDICQEKDIRGIFLPLPAFVVRRPRRQG